MSKIFVLMWMLFNHVLDDYFLQGCFANLKQKDWWKDNYPDDKYKHDYIMALFMHSLSWSFMIMLPIAVSYSFDVDSFFFFMFFINTLCHMFVDDTKANDKSINLIQDQIAHLWQIVWTWLSFMFL